MKLISITEIPKFDLYDITVETDQCFKLDNGIVAHNSMYPKAIMSGGCVEPGTKIVMADDTVKNVEDIAAGEFVKTLIGPRAVTHTWTPETLDDGTPECYEVEFDDGFKVVCSDQHKFLDSNMNWVEAKDLSVGCDVLSV